VSYHCKPFSVEEIEQIATKAVYEWNKTKSLEDLITTISQLRAQQWQMEPLLKNILQQVSFLMGAHSAMIAMQDGDKYNKLLAIGNLCNDEISSYYLESIPEVEDEEIYQNKELAYFRLNKYGVLAIFEKKGKPLNQERTYLVRLFLEQAVLSIQNVGLQEKLLKQEKLSAIGQATGMIVHDLRNSIGVIEMIIDMVVESIDDRKYVMDSLEIIREAAQSGDYTSNKGIQKYSVNGADLIQKIDKNVRPFCKNNEVELKIECPESILMEADADKLFRVISNLVKNAVESFPQRNRVEFPEVNLSMSTKGENTIIKVADNGPGIPDEVADSLFTPFSTHGKRDGTGLGLAIAKQIIELHGGSITVESSHEKGTVFKIIIPNK
jgi:signal transduction histidine kinase